MLALFFSFLFIIFLAKSGERGQKWEWDPFNPIYSVLLYPCVSRGCPPVWWCWGSPPWLSTPLFSLPAGTPSPGEPQQQVDGPAVLGDPGLHVLGWTPHSHAHSGPALRTPEFLQHRQLPVLPGDAGTATSDPMPDAEGSIYESIWYKSGTLKKPWDASSALGESPSLPAGDEPSTPMQEVIALEEPDSEGTPSPVYARVCKLPRVPQPRQPPSPPEPQEEAPPSLPEKCFDVA